MNLKEKKKNLEVSITHSTSIHLWEGLDADRSLSQQGKFNAEGGRVTRIIEGLSKRQDVVAAAANSDDQVQAYQRVMRKMRDLGMTVEYVEGFHSSDLYDFTWVRLNEVGMGPDIAMLWYASQNSRVIYKCEVTSSSDQVEDMSIRWYNLQDVLKQQSKSDHAQNPNGQSTGLDQQSGKFRRFVLNHIAPGAEATARVQS
jgi:hypothetical protein